MVTLSSTEAEYKAVVGAAYELVWFIRIHNDTGVQQTNAATMYCNNQIVLTLVKKQFS
jgi:hypothetical protein